jgi:UPF0716 family protein affecting phage T7 exclusion
MSLVKWGFMGLLALPVAELVVFMVVALSIGWLPALALFLATSLIGVMVLKRSGADFQRFRSDLARQGAGAIQLETPSFAAVIGGILLVIPGFITDVAGALLLLPWARRWTGKAMGRLFAQSRSAPPSPSVIDLEPDQWHQVPEGRIDDKGEPKRRP